MTADCFDYDGWLFCQNKVVIINLFLCFLEVVHRILEGQMPGETVRRDTAFLIKLQEMRQQGTMRTQLEVDALAYIYIYPIFWIHLWTLSSSSSCASWMAKSPSWRFPLPCRQWERNLSVKCGSPFSAHNKTMTYKNKANTYKSRAGQKWLNWPDSLFYLFIENQT